MTVFFLGVIVWAFRPGSKATHRDTANIPFRNETTPARDTIAGGTGRNESLKIGDPS